MREARTQYALLLYHAGRDEDAWVELGALAEAAAAAEGGDVREAEQLATLAMRVRLVMDSRLWPASDA